ncbi:MAG: GNAT family N-acetyltransferase [Acutalibacteraceae bacterium]
MYLSDNKEQYFPELISLWQDVFGDERAYIELLFKKEYKGFDIFAHFESGQIVSVLYLLSAEIFIDGTAYKGKYLYAAATKENFRKKGLMEKLIKDAQCFCKKENLDFISLVPANEKLYDYYGKLGFTASMYRYTLSCENVENIKLPEAFTGNFFKFCQKQYSYACDCLSFYNDVKILEKEPYITFDSEKKLLYSPYDLSYLGECKKQKYGMIYPINSKMKNVLESEIYMNLALD